MIDSSAKRRLTIAVLLSALATAPAQAAQTATLASGQTALSAIVASLNTQELSLRSTNAVLLDAKGNVLYERSADEARPIASITKLMTAMVILDAKLPLDEQITITRADRDLIKLTGSRLSVGGTLKRETLLKLMLMSSENRAALALGRTYPGGMLGIVDAMNEKARALGLAHTRFSDPAGLNPENQSTAKELAMLVQAASAYPKIKTYSTTTHASVYPWPKKGPLTYRNTNPFVRKNSWDIELSKTGYLNEAGRCLVMLTELGDEPVTIVLLNAYGKLTPYGDSNRIKKWLGIN